MKQIDELVIEEIARYSYSEQSMVKVFAYGLIKGIRKFKALHDHLEEQAEVQSWLGWQQVPHRTTLSRRFKGLPEKLCLLIAEVYQKFVTTELIEETVMSVDSSLMQAQGNVWHKKDRDVGIVPGCGNIDTEAHWGISGYGEWTYGYRVHCLVNADADLALPKDVAVHAANLKDSTVFRDELALYLSETTELVLADSGYDEQACYDVCDKKKISLIAPLEVKANTPPERIERATLFNDPETRGVFALRKVSVEPFQGHLKTLFDLDHLPVKGLKNVRSLVTLAAFVYLLLAWINFLLDRPILHLKQTLLALP